MYENDHKASYTWFTPTSPTQNRQGYPGDVIVLGFTTDERFAFSVEQAEGAESVDEIGRMQLSYENGMYHSAIAFLLPDDDAVDKTYTYYLVCEMEDSGTIYKVEVDIKDMARIGGDMTPNFFWVEYAIGASLFLVMMFFIWPIAFNTGA